MMSPKNEQNPRCPFCDTNLEQEKLFHSIKVCPSCRHHFNLNARERVGLILDESSFHQFNQRVVPHNSLNFPDYLTKVEDDRKRTGLEEAVIVGEGSLSGEKAVIGVMDTRFRMGSIGTAAGEKLVGGIFYATSCRLPLIVFSGSGGARIQDGIFSLMQMGRMIMALSRFQNQGGLFISVLTHPTTGITASFAAMGDIVVAEPGALIGFSGPRVIEQTIGEKMPEGFQKSEFLMENGFIDLVISRENLRETLIRLLKFHRGGSMYDR